MEKMLNEKEWKALPENKGKNILSYRNYRKEWRLINIGTIERKNQTKTELHPPQPKITLKAGKEVENVGIKEEIVKGVAEVLEVQPSAQFAPPKLDIQKFGEQHAAQIGMAKEALSKIPPLLRDTNVPPVIADYLLAIHASLKEIEPLGGVLLDNYAKKVVLIERKLEQEEKQARTKQESNAAFDRLEKEIREG